MDCQECTHGGCRHNAKESWKPALGALVPPCFKARPEATEDRAPSGQMDCMVSCKNCETLRKEFTELVAELKATPNGEIEATSRTFIYVTILKKIETILDS